MNAANNPQIEVLFDASARDERTLRFDLDDDEIFGFHVQQAVEKLFKALLTARGENFPLTHDLRILAEKLAFLGEQIPSLPIALDDLSEYAVEARYDKGEAISLSKRVELRAAVADLRGRVRERVDDLRTLP